MPQPTAGDVHVNGPLSNFTNAIIQRETNFVATRMFPNMPVEKQSDRYFTYDRGDWNRDEMTIRAPGTESSGGGYSLDSTPNYFCDVWAHHKDIPDQVRSNADAMLNQDREATDWVMMKALIRKEVAWASKYFVTGVWTTEYAGVSASPAGSEVLQWNASTSTPIEDITNAMTTVGESTGFRPNKMTLGRRVWDKLRNHPEIIDRVKYQGTPNSPAKVSQQAVAALCELDEIVVMDAIYNSAKRGLTNSHAFIGGKSALLAYVAPAPGIMTPTAGLTFSWTGYLGAQANGQRISKFRMENLKSDRVEIEIAFTQKLVSADLGAFFRTIVA